MRRCRHAHTCRRRARRTGRGRRELYIAHVVTPSPRCYAHAAAERRRRVVTVLRQNLGESRKNEAPGAPGRRFKRTGAPQRHSDSIRRPHSRPGRTTRRRRSGRAPANALTRASKEPRMRTIARGQQGPQLRTLRALQTRRGWEPNPPFGQERGEEGGEEGGRRGKETWERGRARAQSWVFALLGALNP